MEKFPQRPGYSFETPIYRDGAVEQLTASIEGMLNDGNELSDWLIRDLELMLNKDRSEASKRLHHSITGVAYVDAPEGTPYNVALDMATREGLEIHLVEDGSKYRVFEKILDQSSTLYEGDECAGPRAYYFAPSDVLTVDTFVPEAEDEFGAYLQEYSRQTKLQLESFNSLSPSQQRARLTRLTQTVSDEVAGFYKGREVKIKNIPELHHVAHHQDGSVTFPEQRDRQGISPHGLSARGYVQSVFFIEQLDELLWNSNQRLPLVRNEPCVLLGDEYGATFYLVPISSFQDVVTLNYEEGRQ